MVQRVIDIPTELEGFVLTDPEVLDEPHIHVPEARHMHAGWPHTLRAKAPELVVSISLRRCPIRGNGNDGRVRAEACGRPRYF